MTRSLSAFRSELVALATRVAIDRVRRHRVGDRAQIAAIIIGAARDAAQRAASPLAFDVPAVDAATTSPRLDVLRLVVANSVGPAPAPKPETVVAAVADTLDLLLPPS